MSNSRVTSAKTSRPMKKHLPPRRPRHHIHLISTWWNGTKREFQSLPQDQKPINWFKFARKHGVKGSSAGQIVKELATSHGIDTYQLDHRTPTRKKRVQKKRLPGGEISVPTNLTPLAVRKSWDDLTDCSELILGEPCSPYTLTRYTTKE